jgi:hypothetical protein
VEKVAQKSGLLLLIFKKQREVNNHHWANLGESSPNLVTLKESYIHV